MMQFNKVKEFKTVYSADVGYLRKARLSGDLHEQIVKAICEHFKGTMLRVDVQVTTEGCGNFGLTDRPIADAVRMLGHTNVYGVIHVRMRLSASCLNRWLPVPKGESVIRVHNSVMLGCRWSNGYQNDEACRSAVRGSTDELEDCDEQGHVTHIYIPSTDSREIPIYPCEPYTPKKADPKSSSQTLSGDSKAEVQSDPGKADIESVESNLTTDRKANNRVEQSVKRLWKHLGMELPMTMRNYIEVLTVGRWLKAEGFTCQEWVDYVRQFKKPESIGEPVPEVSLVEWKSFAKPAVKTNLHPADIIAALKQPEIREAVFQELIDTLDRETVSAIYAEARSADFHIRHSKPL